MELQECGWLQWTSAVCSGGGAPSLPSDVCLLTGCDGVMWLVAVSSDSELVGMLGGAAPWVSLERLWTCLGLRSTEVLLRLPWRSSKCLTLGWVMGFWFCL
jgi:hypothetical protein